MARSHLSRLVKRSPGICLVLVLVLSLDSARASTPVNLAAIPSPVVFQGDVLTAYRDPAAVYHEGWFHLFFTLVKTEPDRQVYSYTATSRSRDLIHWTSPQTLTPRDRNLNFCSPGNLIRFGGEWILCLQTYPRPAGERYGNDSARIWIVRSKNLGTWSDPELLRVKGPDVSVAEMGRMIDPCLFEDKDVPGKWWCIYKQNGLSLSWSHDLLNWTFAGRIDAGENPCVIVDNNEYVLFHSPVHRPDSGIGVKRSSDLKNWRDENILSLGQTNWPWAQGRLTGGYVLDLRKDPTVGKALMFFHGSAYPENDSRGGFDNRASLGIAWSADLEHWDWPIDKSSSSAVPGWPKEVRVVHIASSADGSSQPSLFYRPATNAHVPLLVALHTWSSDYRQPDPGYARWCMAQGWALVHPNFRGPNNQPDAMGSEKVVGDILDAVAYATNHAAIDLDRIYLMGGSGGGYASLLMAGRAPEVWAGVSAWVPIFDLRNWHRECTQAQSHYAQMIEKACGGEPGSSPEVDRQYSVRSASTYLNSARGVPLDINTGIHDGHKGSVPVSHALNAFNAVAAPPDRLAAADVGYITRQQAIPESLSGERVDDALYREKPVRFRRISGNARITIFEGGHEFIIEAGLQWLAQQRRKQPAVWSVSTPGASGKTAPAAEVGK